MLATQRQREIQMKVQESGMVLVEDLAVSFGVARETIRRDLAKMEGEGLVMRSHGGAVSVDRNDYESTFGEREIRNVDEKRAIATEALKFIEENDAIILDASTTAWQISRQLPDMPLTVLTNSVKVLVELSRHSNIRVIATGGELAGRYLSFIGSNAEQLLSNYHVNKLFMSCSGCDVVHGLSDTSEMQASLKRKMIAISDTRYLLVDHSKFSQKNLITIAQLKDFQHLIVDGGVPEETLSLVRAHGVDVHIA